MKDESERLLNRCDSRFTDDEWLILKNLAKKKGMAVNSMIRSFVVERLELEKENNLQSTELTAANSR